MANYKKIQLIAYGVVTSTPTLVLDGPDPNRYQEDAEFRAQRLCAVADWAAGAYASAIADPDTLKVFVAPEFYFRYGGPSSSAEALNNSYPNGEILLPNVNEKILKPHFAQQTFADWLVIAGTMFWHKSAADSGTTRPTYFNTVLALRGGPDTELTPEERAANDDPMEVLTIGASSTNQKALMSRIDYAAGDDRRRWDAALNPMFRLVFTGWEWCRGHMFRVHGVNNPEGRPLVFGLEVCLEHVRAYASAQAEAGVLRALRTRYPELSEIDVHLVSSCGMSLDPASGIEARVNGYAMLCDGHDLGGRVRSWPSADHVMVTGLQPDQRRLTGSAAVVLDTNVLPANLQLGNHDPKDAVSVWSPAPLVY